ncbi:MAG: ABC transporter ATP-binding protein [Oscillospiraceae bacterium]|jgi:ABC-type branched-subunit amino acid transport system ATPase component|nr:ABC transporter ATP-binding protein [Oscillospiraceae bacterium]
MAAILELKDLCKSFGGVHAVNHVSFKIEKGEILGLIGPNGSGKSTCVNLISGVYKADGGDVLFEGKSVIRTSIAGRSRMGIGRTFQSPKPFTGLTVFDSVYTIAMQTRSYKEASKISGEILEQMGLSQYEKMRCEKLPIEKRKWLDMARVLVTRPRVLLLDEVMAGLNPNEIDESVALVRRVNKSGITVLFIEHVMKAVIKLCSRLVVLNDGRLLTSGDPDTVMNDPKVIAAYLGRGYHHAEND